jgi:hypothetical protein
MPSVLFCTRNFFFLFLCTLRIVSLFYLFFGSVYSSFLSQWNTLIPPLPMVFLNLTVTWIRIPSLYSTSCIVYFCYLHSFPSILHAAPLASCISVICIRFPEFYMQHLLHRVFLLFAFVYQHFTCSTSCIVYFCYLHSFPRILHAAPLASYISVTVIHIPAIYSTPYLLCRLFLSLTFVCQRYSKHCIVYFCHSINSISLASSISVICISLPALCSTSCILYLSHLHSLPRIIAFACMVILLSLALPLVFNT